ncbi:hypothetical protein MTR67_040052 [Solanum verrucosum]|uniref:Uncharacterized protein n=1 Tax=Solanum verrucosum TaxID=315347 RepID=A0AAF0ZP44_SOLVR|nr:hypothetical protein MTR67_040052 [Solanum verrucosum]
MTGHGGIREPEPADPSPSEEPWWPSRSVVLHRGHDKARGWTFPEPVVTGQEYMNHLTGHGPFDSLAEEEKESTNPSRISKRFSSVQPQNPKDFSMNFVTRPRVS